MRPGFTLLEVLIAVTIAAMLLLSADVVFEQLADSRVSAARGAAERDDTQNSMELVRRWVRQVDVSPRVGVGNIPHVFAGDSIEAHFVSSCIAPGGWERECEVALRIVSDSGGSALTAISSMGDSASLRGRGRELSLQYLIEASGPRKWVRSWPAGPTTPIAIGIMSPSDTTVFRIGARG